MAKETTQFTPPSGTLVTELSPGLPQYGGGTGGATPLRKPDDKFVLVGYDVTPDQTYIEVDLINGSYVTRAAQKGSLNIQRPCNLATGDWFWIYLQ